MSGSPMLDCERVLHFVDNTTTKSGLVVTSEMNVDVFLSKKQKQDLKMPIVTEKSFEEEANIVYPYTDGALANWNYIITSK